MMHHDPFAPSALILLSAGSVVALAICAAILVIWTGRGTFARRLSKLALEASARGPSGTVTLRNPTAAKYPVLAPLARFILPKDADLTEALRQKMERAGFSAQDAARNFAAFRALSAVLGVGISSIAFIIWSQQLNHPLILALVLVGPMLTGYFAPLSWLDARIAARKEEILAGFPDALDMMLICLEAGQTLDQAVRRVAQESGTAYPALAAELSTLSEQVKAGRERNEVMRDMARRCDLSEITSFVTVLVQASRYGTSITDALRVFALEMRDKRIMRAEEKANLLPTKMTLGTMLFTVPPLMIILIGPSVVAVISDLGDGNSLIGM